MEERFHFHTDDLHRKKTHRDSILFLGGRDSARPPRTNSRLPIRHKRQASGDFLTGLPLRAAFEASLARHLKHGGTGRVALVMVDVMGLKEINDQYGFLAGDDMILAAAACLQKHGRGGRIIARIGGDEFGVLFVGVHASESAAHAADSLGRSRRLLGRGKTHSHRLTMHVGMAVSRANDSPRHLFERADESLRARR
ncbi:MAG: GGDEF domain-containing protein [Planctomycetota bacterium]